MKKNGLAQQDDHVEELSLIDIIKFFLYSWKTITIFAALGIAGAALYSLSIVQQYEATALIKMARIPNRYDLKQTLVIEEPQSLIARMTFPTSYTKEAATQCGMADKEKDQINLPNKVRLMIPKGGAQDTVELMILDFKKENAEACINAIYDIIKSTQSEYVAPHIKIAKVNLENYQKRLDQIQTNYGLMQKLDQPISFALLNAIEEIRYLNQSIKNEEFLIFYTQEYMARLAAPIHVRKQQAYPQKKLILLGLFLGGIIGLLFALISKWYRSQKAYL